MDSYKTYTAEFQGSKASVLIITTASYKPANYPLGEAFVIMQSEQTKRVNFRVEMDRDSFQNAPINSNEDFLHEEALNQAKILIDREHFEKYMNKDQIAPTYKITEFKFAERELLRHQLRGHISNELLCISELTNSQGLKKYLNTISNVKPYQVQGF